MGETADGMGLTLAPDYAHEKPRDEALPTLVMLATAPLCIDWLKIGEGLRAIDKAAHWALQPSSPHAGRICGRGATITIACEKRPMPGYLLAQGMAREHFLKPGQRAQLARHSCQQIIGVELDTRTADYVDVRQTAKAVAMVIAACAMNPAFVGLFNAGTGVAKPADRVRDSITALGQDEVPVAIWTWIAVDSQVSDAVSISSAGMRPFVGFEVECWNAPGDLDSVASRVNDVMRYLLINGDVIKPGETIGNYEGDRSTRCFFGDSKADRCGAKVPAMLLEFDDNGPANPKPDAPVSGLSGAGDLRAMIAELRKGADATSNEALDGLETAIDNPPSRNAIESAESPVYTNLVKLIAHEQETGMLPRPAASALVPRPALAPVAFGRRSITGFGRKGL
jgi:hypothetical protein